MRICVFCGASDGIRPEYRNVAYDFGQLLAREGIGLVYGGASIGVMGAVADGALSAGGEVIGVIPEPIVRVEVAHQGLTVLHTVRTMHERKALMSELADAFVALPGGIGTMEETFEVWTWAQLGEHDKPIALLDVLAYWEAFHRFVDHMVDQGFLGTAHRDTLILEGDARRLLDRIRAHQPPPRTRVLGPDQR